MPLHILAIGVVVGLTEIIAAVHFGGSGDGAFQAGSPDIRTAGSPEGPNLISA